jgi:hypothetical protein
MVHLFSDMPESSDMPETSDIFRRPEKPEIFL